MPCDDVTAEIVVTVDGSDRLADYRYEKMSCGKPIGSGAGLNAFVIGRPIDELAEMPFDEVLAVCPAANSEEEFLLNLEWRALREALRAYLGLPAAEAGDRYRLAEVETEEESVVIRMIVLPPPGMPEIVPCGER